MKISAIYKILLLASIVCPTRLIFGQIIAPPPIDPSVKFACNSVRLQTTSAIPTGANVNWYVSEGVVENIEFNSIPNSINTIDAIYIGPTSANVQAFTFVGEVSLNQTIITRDTIKYNFINPNLYNETRIYCGDETELRLTYLNTELNQYNFQYNWQFSSNAIQIARIGPEIYLLNVPEGEHTGTLIISKDECIDTTYFEIYKHPAPSTLNSSIFTNADVSTDGTLQFASNQIEIGNDYENYNEFVQILNKETGDMNWAYIDSDNILTLPDLPCTPLELTISYQDNSNYCTIAKGEFLVVFSDDGDECITFDDNVPSPYSQGKTFCTYNKYNLTAISTINDNGISYSWSSDLVGISFSHPNQKTTEVSINEDELEVESDTTFTITLTSNNSGLSSSYSRTYTLFISTNSSKIDKSPDLTTITTQNGDTLSWSVEPVHGIEYYAYSMVERVYGDTLFIYNRSTPFAKNVPVIIQYNNGICTELVNIYFAPKYNQLPVTDNNRNLTTSTQQSNLFTIIKLDLPINYEYLEISDKTKIGAPVSHNNDNLIISIDYRLFPSFYGEDELQYKACDGQQCYVGRLSINVEALSNNPIDVYNAVSPNGDGKHDYLHIDRITEYPDNKVVIYNRWGEVLFEVEGYDNETKIWEGKSKNGNPVPDGTYFYTIYLVKDKKDTVEKGFLSVKNN